MSVEASGMRIGELARRVGLGAAVLRAWETRYGLLRPLRSTGGYRLYGPADERRIREVIRLREEGVTVSEACARVLADHRADGRLLPDQPGAPPPETTIPDAAEVTAAMLAAVDTFDESGLHAGLDRLFTQLPLDVAIDDHLMPFLHDVGDRWARGEITVAQEHFVSNLLHRRLGALTVARAGRGGPLAVLAAPSGEHHGLALLALAVLLTRAGWRVRFLGVDTPCDEIATAAVGAQVVVISARREEHLLAAADGIREAAGQIPVTIGGRGATERAAQALGAVRLPARISAAAEALGRAVTTGRP